MPRLDLSLEELLNYRPAVDEADDFDSFWEITLREARESRARPTLTPVETDLSEFQVFDVTFPGFAGELVKAWLTVPLHREHPLPAVVEFNPYGGGRGLPHERLAWPAAGYAYLNMDTRGQGSSWGSGGSTPDPHGAPPSVPGFATRGIENPAGYYYRRLYTDAVRAVDAVRSLEMIDSEKVVVTGASQGGGVALAVAGLAPELAAVMTDVPFLSNLARGVGLFDSDPYAEIVKYLAVHRGSEARVFDTLSYFDGVNFAKRARVPALYSVGLMDPVCPPSTVFASYNHYAGDAEIEVYPYNQHEGGGSQHWAVQARWLRSTLAGLTG